ncbi:MAG: site-specific integrase [Spirochaetales bacterium]|nr:site-specific integrase [Spirochaetales bacterium]
MKKIKDPRLFHSIREFLIVYLPKIRGKSNHTVKAYRDALNLFILFFKDNKHIDIFDFTTSMITGQTVMEFLNWLVEKRRCKVTTRNHRLTCIRSFFKYLTAADTTLIPVLSEIASIVKAVDIDERKPVFLSEKEVKLVLSLPDTRSAIGIRNQLYLSLLYDSGARNNEILSLRLQHVFFSGKNCNIHLVGKGNKTRLIPISEPVTKMVKRYITIFHPDNDPKQYFFYTVHHKSKYKMSADNVARFMMTYEKLAKKTNPDIPHLHPHLFRHARALHLYRAGMPLPLVGEWLGHAQLDTTLIYAYADTAMKRKAIEKATEGNNPLVKVETPRFINNEKTIKQLYGLL